MFYLSLLLFLMCSDFSILDTEISEFSELLCDKIQYLPKKLQAEPKSRHS